DLARSMPALVGACFGCAGQRCLAGSVLVAIGSRSQQDAVVKAFRDTASELKLGDGLDSSATMGPVLNREQRPRILSAIDRGLSEGVRLVLDGRRVSVPKHPRGCFIGPTIFDDAAPDSFLAREEIFGPVVSVLRAGNLNEALNLANRSCYGNSVSLFT